MVVSCAPVVAYPRRRFFKFNRSTDQTFSIHLPVFTSLQKLSQASFSSKALVKKLALVSHCPTSNGDDVRVNVNRSVGDDKAVTFSKQRCVARVKIPRWSDADRFGRKYFRAFDHNVAKESGLD